MSASVVYNQTVTEYAHYLFIDHEWLAPDHPGDCHRTAYWDSMMPPPEASCDGHYGRHLRSKHPNEPLVDVQEPSAAISYKRGRTLTLSTPKSPKRHKDTVETQAIDRITLASAVSPQSAEIESRRTPNHGPDPEESTEVIGNLTGGPQRLPPQYAARKTIKVYIFQHIRSRQFNPLALFDNVYEYKLARFFHENQPETSRVHFKSGHTWRNKMRALIDQPAWHRGTVDFHLQYGCAFYYMDVQCTLAYLLQQRTFAKDLIYEPHQERR
ncbi:hypothetical protein L211DRAFT_849572 [Terfezia boudieri ATCC MYA-4762]|uniref:Uncharacterized protein n=1 Tax=Terfezia boudieri ATCC MYA-4762 TaxID=1051890 RepID=A0A3N4LSG3_9PEZI|nr:hypothetical protein L211DRAFT_849572 [Terfezia boudieri ATCC MYA-4762]